MDNKEIIELITRRRRQILIHSIIYYRYNSNIIPDSQYDKWARELSELHQKYPELSKKANLWKEFEEWHKEGIGSGFNLPLENPIYVNIAENLLKYYIKLTGKM